MMPPGDLFSEAEPGADLAAEPALPWQAAFDAIADAVAVLGRDGRVRRGNRALAALAGQPADALRGQPMAQVLQSVLGTGAEEAGALAPRVGWLHGRLSREVPAAGDRWLSITTDPVPGERGEIGAVMIIADITPRRQAEEGLRRAVTERDRAVDELCQAVKARDDLLSMASHDLRNPLAALKLKVDGLLRRKPDPAGLDQDAVDRLWERLEGIRAQAERTTYLLNQLLDVSRVTSGRIELEPRDIELTSLVREVAQRAEEQLASSGSALTLEGEGEVWGRWDRLRVEQVVTNLLANAIRYGQGRPIQVRVGAAAGAATVMVRDHGIGIAPERQARIFERFERGSLDRQPGSFGLGLWIVKRILDAMGGSIRVESGPGAGAAFFVTLPRPGAP